MLQVEKLTKKYKDFTLEPISFQLPDGFVLGIIGKNGAGKTTLLKSILHQIPVNGGKVIFDESEMRTSPLDVKGKMGFLSQDAPFLQDASLEMNAIVFGGFYPDFSMELFIKYLHGFSLHEEQIYKQCSKGMRMKFQLAFMLSHKPKLILMDEPTAGLDARFRIEFLSILQSYMEKEMATILFSTHITDDLDKIADYILILSQGRMISFDTKENMLEKMKIVSGTKVEFSKLGAEDFYGQKNHGEYTQGLTRDFGEIKRQVEELGLGVSRPNLEQILYFVNDAPINVLESEKMISKERTSKEASITYSWQHQKTLEDRLLSENRSGVIGLTIIHILLFFVSLYLVGNYVYAQEHTFSYCAAAVGAMAVEWSQRNIFFVKGLSGGQNILKLYTYYPVKSLCLILSKLKRIWQNTWKQTILFFVICSLLCIRLGIIEYILLVVLCGCMLFILQCLIVGVSVLKFMIDSDRISIKGYKERIRLRK